MGERPLSRTSGTINRTKRQGPSRVYTACAPCTCPARGRANFRVVAPKRKGKLGPGAWESLSRGGSAAVPSALVPSWPWEARAPQNAPTAAEAPLGEWRKEAQGEGVPVNNPHPARRIPAGGLGWAPRAVLTARSGESAPTRCRQAGRYGSDEAGLTAAGTLLSLQLPLPPPPGLPRLLPARGGPAPSPPWAGPSLCPRPGPRAAAWARGGAEARRWAPRAHTPGGWTRGAGLSGPAAAAAPLPAPAAEQSALALAGPGGQGPASFPPTDNPHLLPPRGSTSSLQPRHDPCERNDGSERTSMVTLTFIHSTTHSFIQNTLSTYCARCHS